MLGGLAAGVAIGAMVAATVATGGLAGALIVGACMAGGLSIGGALAAASQSMGSNCGTITSGSPNVTFEGKAAARVTDVTACSHHASSPEPLVEGSKTITINGLPLVRIGHSTHCSAKVNAGRKSVWVDRTTGQYGPKNPELSAGEEFLAGLLGGMLGAKLGGLMAKALPKREPTQSAEVSGKKDEVSTCKEDPIDVATGEMVDIRTDIAIPGVLPLQLTRRYRTRSDDRGLLGPRWSTSWSQRLEFADGYLVRFHNAGGQAISFVAPDVGLDGVNLREPRYRDEPRIFDYETRQVLVFSPLIDGGTSRLERIEDLSGNSISFAYDTVGRLAELAHTDGYRLKVRYHGSENRVDKIDLIDENEKLQTLVEYAYSNGMLARVASFQSGQFGYTYDANGWMTSWLDSDQTEVRYRYDNAGRVVQTETRQKYHTGYFIYEEARTRVVDGDGEWLYEYDSNGLVTSETDPLGHRTLREWQLGRLVSQTDALGRSTAFEYDARGNLIAIREPGERVTRFEYDDNRLMSAVELNNGGRVRFEYDHLQRLTARIAPDGSATRYRYGERGELLRVVDGDCETRLDYDEQLRLISTRLPTGAEFRTVYDVLGRLLEEAAPDGGRAQYTYQAGPKNPRGMVSEIAQADSTTISVRYNSEGLPVERVDPLGRVTRREYGPFDLVTASIDAAGHITRFEYDHATRLTKVVNALRETWEYRYDAAGRLIAEIDWGGRITRYDRDAVGRLLVKTLPDGGQWRYEYDGMDRLTSVDAGDVRLAYTYDERGRLAAAEVHGESTHVTRFAYDAKGRLIGEDQHGHLLRHIYDARGARAARITPHRETEYEYDRLGALTKVGAMSILRDELGRDVGRQAGEFVLQRRYDLMGRLQRQAAGPKSAFERMERDPVRAFEPLARQVYSYDSAGQLRHIDTDADSIAIEHDVRGQVTSVRSALGRAERYSYDANRNIAGHGHDAPGDMHRYLAGGLPERVGYTRYKYDARGRTVEKTVEQPGFRPKTWHYSWDGLNRLVKVHTPDRGVWIYRYDAFNRRVEKRPVGGQAAVRFLWDGYVLAERWEEKRDGTTGRAVTWHISPSDYAPLAQETDEGLYPILADQVGMPKAVFTQAGERVWSAAASVWGKILPAKGAANEATGTGAAFDTSLRFAGQWEDEESGLSYNLHRYYDPETAQYLSVDPIGLAGGARTHAYVGNPTSWVDPLGLAACTDLRARVLRNIEESRSARTASQFDIHLARSDQVRWGYAADEWGMATLKQGARVYGGIPGQSAYYTSEQTLASSGLSRESLFQSLQVKPHPVFGYRPQMGVYEVVSDIAVPSGVVRANPALGPGEGTQYFIQGYASKLRLVETIDLGM
jgi:RHS repeat-associated protein